MQDQSSNRMQELHEQENARIVYTEKKVQK